MAFFEAIALPRFVTGPRDFLPLRRLISGLAIINLSQSFSAAILADLILDKVGGIFADVANFANLV